MTACPISCRAAGPCQTTTAWSKTGRPTAATISVTNSTTPLLILLPRCSGSGEPAAPRRQSLLRSQARCALLPAATPRLSFGSGTGRSPLRIRLRSTVLTLLPHRRGPGVEPLGRKAAAFRLPKHPSYTLGRKPAAFRLPKHPSYTLGRKPAAFRLPKHP